jgi:DNA (cytosine-5)-methyltransferase 1
MKVLDLFCGCGGMSQGLKEAGLDVIMGIDHWDKATESYQANQKHRTLCADLRQVDPASLELQEVDIIVGGPPCQGFSMAGKRESNDPRNSLFMEYVRFLDYFNPKAFVMENVMGILSMKTENNESCIKIITDNLGRNYNYIVCKLYASDFGVPQNRRRVIIIGIRKDLNIIPTEPIPLTTPRPPVSTIIQPRQDVDASHFLSERAIAGINAKKERSKAKGHGFGAQFLNTDKPSYTISARYWKDGSDALVKYDDTNIRRLTILELKRIQSFPDDYVLCGSKKDQIMQIGNAVACKFAKSIGEHIISLLQSSI